MNRPTKPRVHFCPADRQMVTEPLPFQGVPFQNSPFCFSICMVAQAIFKEVQSRNILANALADMRPSLAFMFLTLTNPFVKIMLSVPMLMSDYT